MLFIMTALFVLDPRFIGLRDDNLQIHGFQRTATNEGFPWAIEYMTIDSAAVRYTDGRPPATNLMSKHTTQKYYLDYPMYAAHSFTVYGFGPAGAMERLQEELEPYATFVRDKFSVTVTNKRSTEGIFELYPFPHNLGVRISWITAV